MRVYDSYENACKSLESEQLDTLNNILKRSVNSKYSYDEAFTVIVGAIKDAYDCIYEDKININK